ncbi:EscT/YscT/HrcT family type III secretion system export apparatus protein [Citrobacter amalonaticus]|uniref:EscT/YscT/HrcT family type III secretion system export apparatus protein n=1 Tax=Citrobacter amalonaticus TaxID=35703 RepID=A0A2S4S2I8_CITAM|nr:type III secretion system export apparatus subunit SctT [Citrobacter amalonaticus]POT59499.1 EscT/YscT/HrcT family type III secretion system export apparatus protein [Citrobacter amalonaticus]POT77629.1 EscT/YscT/HrcT family type III secretion system export apparatus protein [Citrobacter amalonaticus]POU68081.1 EscT/YscT/HrcT family type III secretion system export apparatus protein [Citrobacter amalonaticus]POV07685.1 EscT/YscT/HrcT family type III secretion system export apparatus protein 
MNYYADFHLIIITTIYGMARLLPIFLLLPYLNSQMLGGMIVKNVIIIFIVIGFLPLLAGQYADIIDMPFLAVVFKEIIVGLMCGFCFAIPFWIVLAIGEIIDNQRGATISSTMNPGIGVDASFMASFMNFYFSAIFVINDGMAIIVKAVYETYTIFPLNEMFAFKWSLVVKIISLLNTLMSSAVILVGPVVVSLFLIEISIGVLSRFAPQLNAFSVALSIKSFIAFLVLLIYMTSVLTPRLLEMKLLSFLRMTVQ